MHSAISLIAQYVINYNRLIVPLLLNVLATVSNLRSPVQHSLLVTAISWLLLCVLLVFRVGFFSARSNRQKQTAWLVGVLISLSYVYDRAACDTEGTWATKPLLPLFTVLLSSSALLTNYIASSSHHLFNTPAAKTKSPSEGYSHTRSYRLLAALVLSASAILASHVASPTSAIGLSSAVLEATGLVLFEAVLSIDNDNENNTRGDTSVNGPFSEILLTILRDVAGTIAVICGFASWFMEPSLLANALFWQHTHIKLNRDWKNIHTSRILQQILWTIPINLGATILTYIMISRDGAINTSLIALFSFICAKLHDTPSPSGFWFAMLYSSSALVLSFGSSSPTPFIDLRNSIRIRRVIFVMTMLSIVLFLFSSKLGAHHPLSYESASAFVADSPQSPFGPIPMDLSKGHPAAQLIKDAEANFQFTLSKQSKSLAAAVQEYRRRNGIVPPPFFDKWYQFATRNNVVMIDEFDTINDMLLPFWALKPVTIRSRVSSALGHEDIALIGLAIRNGAIELIENGEKWQREAIAGMLESFLQYLPDMDLAFNMHDEPRVIVPNNLLSAMIIKARDETLPRVARNPSPRNIFSARPDDVNDGKRFIESSTTRFNRFAHQQTWTHSRLSCPANTQAQTFEDYAADNLTAYAIGPLGYVYNATAFSDICNSPSLSSSFGFFERPNTFNVVNELTPIFSSSKISSFQDLLYPSPWYWIGKVGYDETRDTSWENKTNSIYWRGSTTGGYSRNGGWRRQHRQHIVQRLNAPDKAHLLSPTSISTDITTMPAYSLIDVDRKSLKHLVNVKFSHVGQCDPGDCSAQKEFFHVTDRVDGQNAWYHKHLLDMDGNAFSGRFYSFLKSRSLTYKMAIFREWHAEWLWPWVHYIPLSLKGDEHLDLIKWFGGDQTTIDPETTATIDKIPDKGGNGDTLGERKAREMAQRSTEWHDKVLRNADFEVWFFRLLLEYGRVIDENREEIGYHGP